jgi:hypothetical protein
VIGAIFCARSICCLSVYVESSIAAVGAINDVACRLDQLPVLRFAFAKRCLHPVVLSFYLHIQ